MKREPAKQLAFRSTISESQLRCLAMLMAGPRSTSNRTTEESISGNVARSLIARGWAKVIPVADATGATPPRSVPESYRVAITDDGLAVYREGRLRA